MYEYSCKVVRVVDADTLDLDIDLGLSVTVRTRVRLAGIDAPEMSTPQGKAAKIYAQQWVDSTPELNVETVKDREDKYGRYLAVLWNRNLVFAPSLNTQLVNNGHAKLYDGGKR